MTTQPTYVACLTPAGTGAIATVALVGPDAWSLLAPLLRPPTASPGPGAFRLARIGNEATDQVVVTLDRHEHQQRIEIHCHGGPAVVRWLIDLLAGRGAVEIDWQRHIRLTSPSVVRAEVMIALAHARTATVAAILLDQCQGRTASAIGEAIESIRQQRLDGALGALDSLLAWERFSQHLVEPWRVVLAGVPNVGKSTLLNALAGYRRSITDPTPGTTRDLVRVQTAFGGWPVELIDTAGIRDAAASVEAMGIDESRASCRQADLVLWVLDVSQPRPTLLSWLPQRTILVLNKIDLPASWSAESLDTVLPWLTVSAERGDGIENLANAIAEALVPVRPSPGAPLPVGAPVFSGLQAARDALAAGRIEEALAALTALLASPAGS